MPRKPRVVAAGAPHHVTPRGNNRQDIFLVDEDRRFYLAALAANSRRYGLHVVGYCLMTNHVHWVVVPDRPDSLRLTLQRTQSHYAQRFNRRYARCGHLWQGRFFSCPLGRDHLVTALAYVDLNPVRAHIVGRADHYPWSSAARLDLRPNRCIARTCRSHDQVRNPSVAGWIAARRLGAAWLSRRMDLSGP